MLIKSASFAALALFTVFTAGGEARAEDAATCKLVKVGELPVRFEHNQPLVPVSINGKPGWFLIDTGAASSMLWGGAEKAYGLRVSTADRVKFYGVGGGRDAMFATLSTFALADVKVKDLTMFVVGEGGSPDRTGLLGRDVLGRMDIEFDLANKLVRLFQPTHCGMRSLAYWTTTPDVADLRHEEATAPYSVKVVLNGKAVQAMLDSGAAITTVTPEAARIAGVQRQAYTDEFGSAEGVGAKRVPTRIATFDSVGIGEEQIKHARLSVADLFAANTEGELGSILQKRVALRDEPTMLLGADFLRSHRAMLVTSQHRLYFTYSGGPVFQVVGDAVKPAGAEPDPAAPGSSGK